MPTKLVLISMAVALGTLSGCATNMLTSGRVAVVDENSSAAIAFSDRDRELIRKYYRRSHNNKHRRPPPGLAKKGRGLPPGLIKRDILPSGLRGRELPVDLEARLVPLPGHYARLIVGTDMVIVKRSTRVIVDIYRDFHTR